MARQLAKIRPPKTPYRRLTTRPWKSNENSPRGPRSQQIWEFRQAAGWSRFKLAKMMRCHHESILCWEEGSHDPKNLAWDQFIRVRRNYRQKLRRQGKDLDGGPVME